MSAGPTLERAIPTAQAIRWHPTGVADVSGDAYPIFLASRVLRAVQEHAAATPNHGALGFLVGDLCTDARSATTYIIVDSTIRLNQAIYGDRTMVVVGKLWTRIESEVDKVQGRLLGWYHSHPPHGIGLTAGDIDAHLRYFTEPWQVALVLGDDAGAPGAALFRPGSATRSATTPLPFFELADEADEGQAPGWSALPWANFRTDVPVTQHARPAAERDHDETPTATRTTLEVTGRDQEDNEAGRGVNAKALAGLPLIDDEARASRDTRPAPAATRVPGAAAPPPRLPLMEPAAHAPARGRRSWRAIAIGAAVLLAGATAVVVWRTVWQNRSGEQTADGDVEPALMRTDALADTLAVALASYGRGIGDAGGNPALCDELQRGLVSVDQAWIAYNERGKVWVSGLDAERAQRDERLYARVDSVERRFAASGCQRP